MYGLSIFVVKFPGSRRTVSAPCGRTPGGVVRAALLSRPHPPVVAPSATSTAMVIAVARTCAAEGRAPRRRIVVICASLLATRWRATLRRAHETRRRTGGGDGVRRRRPLWGVAARWGRREHQANRRPGRSLHDARAAIMGGRDGANDREPQAGAAAGARLACAGEALERPIGEAGTEPGAVVRHVDLHALFRRSRFQVDLSPAVADGVVDEVSRRLAHPQLGGHDEEIVCGVNADPPVLLGRTVDDPVTRTVEQRANAQRLLAYREAAAGGAGQHEQVLGKLGEPVALRDGRDERNALLAADRAAAQGAFELRLDDRDRRAQLVAGVGDEPPLALERPPQPGEHLVGRLAGAPDLVPRRPERQLLGLAAERDGGRAPAPRLDLRPGGGGRRGDAGP